MAESITSEKLLSEFRKAYPDIAGQTLTEYTVLVTLPITSVKADVKETAVEDYEIFEYVILKLYALGITDTEDLTALTGLRYEMTEKILKNEKELYGHIDIITGELTETGRNTLSENDGTDGKTTKQVEYKTKRRFQAEAVTGTVIPAYIENHREEWTKNIDDSNSLIPRDTVEITGELEKEINKRLEEYAHKDIIELRDCVCLMDSLEASAMFFRKALAIKLKQLQYPFLVLMGRRQLSNVGSASKAKKRTDEKARAYILSLAQSDAELLKRGGADISEIIVREDRYFQYLSEQTAKMPHDQTGQ